MKLRALLITLMLPVAIHFTANAQSVAITADGTAADNSAMLDVKSNTKGLLVPRMTAASRVSISTPARGLLIFQTDATAGFYYNMGTPAVPNWQLLGATGATGAGFANGTAAGQIYLTGASPYAPQAPQTVTGDVTISSGAVTTIAGNAITTGKIADDAITNAKIAPNAVGTTELAAGSVTVPKINATGTASSTTYLRGDGAWTTPAGGAAIALIATNTAAQTLPAGGSTVAPATVSFNNVVTAAAAAIGTFSGSNTFTVSTPGIYLVTVAIMGTGTPIISPVIYSNNIAVAYGTGVSNTFFPAPVSRSGVTTVLNLAANDNIVIKASPASQTLTQPLTTDGSTRLTIIKL